MNKLYAKNFFKNSPIGIYVIRNNKFCCANDRFQEITGFAEEVLLTKYPLDIVHPEDRKQVKKNAVLMLKGERKEPYEFRIITRTGEIRWILETTDSIRFMNKRSAAGHSMDITQAKQLENAMKVSEQKYRSIFELAREGIVIVNYKDGSILAANAEFQRQSGYLVNVLKKKKLWELQPSEFQNEAEKSFFRFKENRGGIISWKLCENKNGKVLPVEIVAQHMFMEDQDAIICMVRDITEREAMMRALSMASEEWRKSFDALDDVVMLISPDFKILRANVAASRLLDIDIRRIIGKTCYEIVHGTNEPPDYCPHLKAQSKGIYCEAEQQESYLKRTLRFCASPIRDDKGVITHTVEVISDVTSRRQTEAQSIRLSKDLAASFSGITEALSELVESRDPYTAGHSKHVARLAVDTGKEMGFSKTDLEGLHVCALLHDVGKAIIPAAILNKPGKLSEHEWGLIKEHPTTAYETLRRIPFPWPVADVVYQHHERLDGSGYPLGLMEDKIHIWTRIITVADVFDAMTSHRPYRPCMPRQKAIDVLSNGQGIIYDSKVVAAFNRALRMDDMRVMIVDYDRDVVEGIAAELRTEQLEPVGYTDSKIALKIFTKKFFPLVITEIEMPGINGAQLTRKIKELNPNTEVIVLAKRYSKKDMLRTLRAGASDFLEKPIEAVMFRKCITRAMHRFASKTST